MRNFLWVSLVFITFILGCKRNKESFLIPGKTFKNILVDIHLADGLYMQKYAKFIFHTDSTNFYNDIFKTYGYSKQQFDSTFKWYSNHPKEFETMYDDIVNELNKLDQQNIRIRNIETDSLQNIYKGKKTWLIPKDKKNNKIPFNIRIKDSASYTIYVLAKVFPDDESNDLKITAFYWTNNGTKEGKRNYFPEVKYEKGKRFVLYSTNLTTPNKKITHLKGWLLNYNDGKTSRQHIEIKTIYISSKINDYEMQ